MILSKRIYNALVLARKIHHGQFRRDGITPYFSHVNRVFKFTYARTRDEDILCAAIFHDSDEDGENAIDRIREAGFSERTIELVKILTRGEDEKYEDYLIRILKDDDAVTIKLADIHDNITDAPTEKQLQKYLRALEFLVRSKRKRKK